MESPDTIFLDALRNNDTAAITPQLVDELVCKYPFFTLPAAMLLEHNPDALNDDATRERLLAHLALNAGDAATMMQLIDPEARELLHFYPVERPVETTTDDAIDTFLTTYGGGQPSDSETALLEKLIFNPVPDYSEVLERETEPTPAATDEQSQRIDAFLAAYSSAPSEPETDTVPIEEPGTPAVSVAAPTIAETPAPTPAASLSESLARIYIKQRKYQKAYDILSTIARDNPDASPFVADQLRFLAKVIAMQK